MERLLFKLFLGILLMSLCVSAFSQVKLHDSGVTKFYDNGTRITYFEMADFPNSAEMREYVAKIVLENPDINRAKVYTDGKTFMYDAKQSIEPDMVLDAVNEALAEYKSKVGDFPQNDSPSTVKPASNVTVTPHVTSQSAGEHKKFEVIEEKSVVKSNEGSMQAVPASEIKRAVRVTEIKNADDKSIESVSPQKYNESSKNK